jgi:hypothetical protein
MQIRSSMLLIAVLLTISVILAMPIAHWAQKNIFCDPIAEYNKGFHEAASMWVANVPVIADSIFKAKMGNYNINDTVLFEYCRGCGILELRITEFSPNRAAFKSIRLESGHAETGWLGTWEIIDKLGSK